MMMGGRDKQVRECHSFEVAVDTEAGLLVVGQSTQASHDNGRLPDIITAAEAHEPEGETFELTLRGRPQQIGCTPRRTGGCTLPLSCATRQLRTFVRRMNISVPIRARRCATGRRHDSGGVQPAGRIECGLHNQLLACVR